MGVFSVVSWSIGNTVMLAATIGASKCSPPFAQKRTRWEVFSINRTAIPVCKPSATSWAYTASGSSSICTMRSGESKGIDVNG